MLIFIPLLTISYLCIYMYIFPRPGETEGRVDDCLAKGG